MLSGIVKHPVEILPHQEWVALTMNNAEPSHGRVQLVWGILLVAVGIAVFFRIPQVMPKLAEMGQPGAALVFIRICFYIMGIVLVGGGTKKIIYCLQKRGPRSGTDPSNGDN